MQLPAELQSISDKIRLAEEEEKKKRELEKATQRELISKANESVSTGVDASSLPQDKLQLFQKLIEENLLRREAAMKFFEEQMKRDPNVEARRLKQADREGRNPVANFFRNLDYALGDGAGRDKAIAQKQISDARTSYDSLAKDQGLEINRAIGDQNKLFTALKGIEQRGNAAAMSAQGRMMQNDTAAALGGQRNTIAAGRADSLNQRDASQIKLNEHKMQFSPFGAFGKDFNEILHLQRLREQGKGAEADLLEKEMKDRKALNYIMQMASKGGFGTTREQIIPGVDARGNVTYTKGTATSRVNNPWRDKLETMLQNPQGKASSTIKYDESSPTTAVEQLKEAATNANPQKKAVQVVNKAIGKSASDNQKQFIAAQALSLGLSPKQIESDAARARLGDRYVVDDASDGENVINTGMKKAGVSTQMDKVRPLASADSKINTAARSIIDAGAEGKLDKIFGPGNNKLSAIKQTIGATTPGWFSKSVLPASEIKDVSQIVERMYPELTKTKDPEVRQFVNQITNLVGTARAAVALKESGKALTTFELEDIESRLPKLTDTPEVAIEKMVTFALTERMSDYLATKGYSLDSIQKANNVIGDYIGPRVKQIVKEIGDAKAYNANGAVKSRKEAVKHLDFRVIDPEDIFGDAVYTAVKKSGGTLRDFEAKTGIKVRRLIPDDGSPTSVKPNGVGSPSVKPKSAEERMEEIRRKYGVR